MPAVEIFSFLKEMRPAPTWTTGDLAKSLNISNADAKRIIPVLQMQGYVKPSAQNAQNDEWLTTQNGNIVSGSATPRFTRESVEQALSSLAGRIRAINREPKARYKITEAVAFGDFLDDQPRVQAADVGIRLTERKQRSSGNASGNASAGEHAAQREFLKQLRGKNARLHLKSYEPWMSTRSHRKLL